MLVNYSMFVEQTAFSTLRVDWSGAFLTIMLVRTRAENNRVLITNII